jgi:hypothetical protein
VSATPAFAVATTKYTLTNSGWTDLGAGPMLLSFQGSGVFAVGDTTPTLVNEGFGIRAGRSFPVKTTSHVWARATGAFGVNAYAAPINAGGSTGCTEATSYLARATGETTHAADLTTLICGLVTDGVWPKLDALYVLAQQTQADALLNLKGTNYGLTSVGLLRSATFTSFVGFGGFSNTVFLNTGFNPITAASPNYVLNNASYGIWSYAVVAESAVQMGTTDGVGSHVYLGNNVSGLFYPRINDSGAYTQTTAITKGLFVAERTNSTTAFGYQNGVGSSGSIPSDQADNGSFTIGHASLSAATTQTLSEAHIGASLGSAGNLALYNRLAAYMAAIAPTGCAEATAYLARATGETAHAADLTTLICGLVTDGVWPKLDALYVLAQQTQADARLNLVGTNYSLTDVNGSGLTFTSYVGFSDFFVHNNALVTNFDPTTAGSPHFTQNSASFGVWIYTSVLENSTQMGNSVSGAGSSNLYCKYAGNLFYAQVNDAAVNSIPDIAGGVFYVGDRSSSSQAIAYINGASQGISPGTSAAPVNSMFNVGYSPGGSAPSANTLSAAFIGGSLGSLNLALYNRLRTYMTAVGVP